MKTILVNLLYSLVLFVKKVLLLQILKLWLQSYNKLRVVSHLHLYILLLTILYTVNIIILHINYITSPGRWMKCTTSWTTLRNRRKSVMKLQRRSADQTEVRTTTRFLCLYQVFVTETGWSADKNKTELFCANGKFWHSCCCF